jgi:hypothetical protein
MITFMGRAHIGLCYHRLELMDLLGRDVERVALAHAPLVELLAFL